MVETRRLNQLSSRLSALLDVPEGRLVIALSGGADSATMAYLLAREGRSMRAVHINHGLASSPALENAARAIARTIGVDLAVISIDVPLGSSPEGMARRARYDALTGAMEPGEVLLTGHTLEDQAETVLLNVLRGTGPAGLGGIPPRTGLAARPMLEVTRSETRELAALAGLLYFDDPTNLDPAIRRNSIRLEILPTLSSRFNPRLVEALARLASLVRSDEGQLESQVDAVPLLVRDGAVAVAIGDLAALPAPLADRVLRRCLSQVRPPHHGTMAEMDHLREVMRRERSAARLAGDVAVSVEGPLLVLRPVVTTPPQVSAPVDLGVGSNVVDGFEVEVEMVDRVCRVAPVGAWSAVFDPESRLRARVDDEGRLIVEADGEVALVAGERRLGVAWYRPGTSGYLSVFAREGSGWTSSR